METVIAYYFIICFIILFIALIKKGHNIPDLKAKELIVSCLVIIFWLPVSLWLYFKEVL